MAHAIIRGKNGRRYEVDFGDAPVRVEVHASEETVEIFVEADFETHPEERRRFAIINIPRHLFSEATGRTAEAEIARLRRAVSDLTLDKLILVEATSKGATECTPIFS